MKRLIKWIVPENRINRLMAGIYLSFLSGVTIWGSLKEMATDETYVVTLVMGIIIGMVSALCFIGTFCGSAES